MFTLQNIQTEILPISAQESRLASSGLTRDVWARDGGIPASQSEGSHGQLAVSIGRGSVIRGKKAHDEKSARRGYHPFSDTLFQRDSWVLRQILDEHGST